MFTDPHLRRRRCVTNLMQVMAWIHGCQRCDGCKLRAEATYSQLDRERPEPA